MRTRNIVYSPKAALLDGVLGGEAEITAKEESYPEYFEFYKSGEMIDVIHFWKGYNFNKNTPTKEEIISKEYNALGCKVTLKEDFKHFIVEVDEGYEWDYISVGTRWVNGYSSSCRFYIVLNPEYYDYIEKDIRLF